MSKLIINNKIILYKIRKNRRAKRILISIVQGDLRITVPENLPDRKVKEILEANKNWIYDQIIKQEETLAHQQPIKNFVEGEKFLYQGQECILYIRAVDRKIIRVTRSADKLLLEVPQDVKKEKRTDTIRLALSKWYRQQAKMVFTKILDEQAHIMGVQYNRLLIKDQRTRWGSCSNKKNINLNWRLIMAPVSVLQYVIIHELAHLKYMNHSKDFWNFVSDFMPDYKRWEKWLREKGHYLVNFNGF